MLIVSLGYAIKVFAMESSKLVITIGYLQFQGFGLGPINLHAYAIVTGARDCCVGFISIFLLFLLIKKKMNTSENHSVIVYDKC